MPCLSPAPPAESRRFNAKEIGPMSTIINVIFDRQHEIELIGHPLPSRDEASRWLDEQWLALECETSNPMGKVLLLDKILSLARYAGERRFAEAGDWAREYADAVATLLGRPSVRIDVADSIVG
jgi:hypothetical protein